MPRTSLTPLTGFPLSTDYDGLLYGTFRQSFPTATLQRAGVSPAKWRGAAIVEQLGNGLLQLTFLAAKDASEGQAPLELLPGSVRTKSDHLWFEGIDLIGNPWVAKNLEPSGTYGPAGCELRCDVFSIERTFPSKAEELGYVRAWLPYTLDMPPINRGHAFFGENELIKWRVAALEARTQIEVACKVGRLSYVLFQRFCVALGIVAARDIDPVVVECIEPPDEFVSYRSRTWRGGFSKRPALPHTGAMAVPSLNEFISAFVLRIGDNLLPVRSLWRQVHQDDLFAESGTVVLSVAIEQMLRACFPDAFKPTDPEFLSSAEAVAKAVEQMVAPERTKRFFSEAVRNLRRPSPKSAMNTLRENGEIAAEHVAAWNWLRHSAVHEDVWRNHPPAKVMLKEAACYALFMRLIFSLVGYDGPQRLYHLPGFPFERWRQ